MLHSVDQIAAYVRSFGAFAVVVSYGLIVVQCTFPYVPFIIIAAANVIIFGLIKGFIINYTASCLGSVLMFVFARYFGRAWVERKFLKYKLMRQFSLRMRKDGFYYVLIGRLIYVFPSTVVNLGAGLARISLGSYVAATMLGKFPIIFMESMIVHDMQHLHQYMVRLLFVSGLFVVLLITGYFLRRSK